MRRRLFFRMVLNHSFPAFSFRSGSVNPLVRELAHPRSASSGRAGMDCGARHILPLFHCSRNMQPMESRSVFNRFPFREGCPGGLLEEVSRFLGRYVQKTVRPVRGAGWWKLHGDREVSYIPSRVTGRTEFFCTVRVYHGAFSGTPVPPGGKRVPFQMTLSFKGRM